MLLLLILFACLPLGAASYPEPRYHAEALTPANRNLSSRYRPAQVALLEKLNRADAAHLSRLKILIVPDRWDLDEVAYSPLPALYPPGASRPKLMIVDLGNQVFGAYEHGKLVRWGPVSSGKKSTPTPPGLFHLNWWSKGRKSTVNPSWYMPWYFNFLNREGLAFHAYALPGYPASHACVRLLERDAIWLCGWGEGSACEAGPPRTVREGTPVLITGAYNYGSPPLWRDTARWSRPIELPPRLEPIK